MAAHRKTGYLLSQQEYAFAYGVHINTIHHWQNKGLPLDDPKALIDQQVRGDINRALRTFKKSTKSIVEEHAQMVRERRVS